MEKQQIEDAWVAGQLEGLSPPWIADDTRGQTALRERLDSNRYHAWRLALGVAVLACLILAFTPQVRGVAQAVWARWTVSSIDMVTADLSTWPFDTSITSGRVMAEHIELGAVSAADSQVEAERRAGFAIRLPPSVVMSGAPRFTIVKSIEIGSSINVARLGAALARAGAEDLVVPAEWNGAVVRAHIAAAAVATYPAGVEIVQIEPVALYVPVGIALNHLAEVVFRSAGLPAREAKAAGLAYAIQPAWLMHVAAEDAGKVQRIELGNGNAWLVEEVDASGRPVETVVLRSTAERIYAVTSPDRATSLRVAAALP